MNKRKKINVLVLIMILTLSVLVVSNQPPKSVVEELEQPAKFVIASWDFPDDYGQGIETLTVYENSTGDWLAVGGFSPNVDHSEAGVFDWNISVGIKVRVDCWLNSSLVGVGSTAEGKNYLRHNISATMFNGTQVFSQQNLTYFGAGALGDMYEYYYDVVLNFLPVGGEVYTVTITYEIFYGA